MPAEHAANPDSTTNDVLLVFIPADAPEWWLKRMALHHADIEVRWANATAPDRSLLRPENLPVEIWDGVTMLCTYVPPPPHLVPGLRFVQLTSAGFDLWTGHPTFEDAQVQFCTANGIHP
jgi:hypothetical protein